MRISKWVVLISEGLSPWEHGFPLSCGSALLWDSKILNAACRKKTEGCMGTGASGMDTFSHIPLAGTQPWGHTSLQGHLGCRICVLRKQRKRIQRADESSSDTVACFVSVVTWQNRSGQPILLALLTYFHFTGL